MGVTELSENITQPARNRERGCKKRCYIQCNNRTRQCGFFRCFWNNNEMSHISKERRGKSEGGRKGERESVWKRVRGVGVFTGDSAVSQRNHPLIKEDSLIQLIRGRSGERKVSEVRQYNSRSIQKLFAAKREFLFIFFPSPSALFPSLLLPLIPLPFCLLLPFLLHLLLFFSCAVEGFALGDLLCCLNYMQQNAK